MGDRSQGIDGTAEKPSAPGNVPVTRDMQKLASGDRHFVSEEEIHGAPDAKMPGTVGLFHVLILCFA